VAAAWIIWLLTLCAALLFGVALPLYVRIALCVAAATSTLAGIRSLVLLRGAGAVRALEWSEAGEFTAYVGSDCAALPASVTRGSFRSGAGLLVLRLATPKGIRAVLIDGTVQDTAVFRRLCRHLAVHSHRGLGPPTPSTVTIRPKV
jgi:hypothetical protein